MSLPTIGILSIFNKEMERTVGLGFFFFFLDF